METNNNYYYFVPIAVEIMGPWGDYAKKKNEIGEKIHKITNELRATSYLIQRITIAVQRGNAASILETTQDSNNEKLEEIFYIL
jgi:ADP-dependent phosphofructokinase/glucokinase